jgi:hypothetical protein
MEYLATVWNAGSKIEAHVDVRSYQGEVEADFCSNLVYVDDEVVTLDEVNETLLELLLDDAHDQWAMAEDES